MRKVIKAMIYLIILIVFLLILTGVNIIYFGLSTNPIRSDCIIVLGCKVYGTVPSPFLKSRLEEGLRLYNEGFGEYIIVSGGRGRGEDIAEAEAMKNYLVSRGVNSDKIIMEDQSFSTMENIKYSYIKMKEYNFNTVVIVSNKYHLKRASMMAKKIGVKASCSGVFVSQHMHHEITGFIREILALLKFCVIG